MSIKQNQFHFLIRRMLNTNAVLCCAALSHISCVQLFVTSMDCSPAGSSLHGVFQARVLEWVAISSSRGSPGDLPNPRIEPASLSSPALAGRFFTTRQTLIFKYSWLCYIIIPNNLLYKVIIKCILEQFDFHLHEAYMLENKSNLKKNANMVYSN